MSWAVGVVFGLFGASIEAVQRLDLTTKISVTATTVRVLGTAVLLYLGYGLVPVGLMVISSQVVSYVLYFYFYRRLFTGVRLSLHLASLSTLKELSKFGIHSFLMTFSTQLQSQSATVLIGHFLPAAFVGYYNLPMRLVQYAVEFVAKIGIVTNINAAELSAKDDTSTLSQLAIYTNRYCLVIFMPLAILLWVDGRQFFALWVGEKVAVYSVQVLPILLLGFVVAVVGQFSSSMLLMGMAKHQRYARALLVEALLGFVLLTYAIPRYGMVGAAWVVAVLMILIRGVYTWYIVSQTVGISMWSYVRGVYLSPVMAAVPVFILAKLLKTAVIPGHSWFQIALLGAVIGLTYYSVALFVSARSDHRRLLLQKLGVG
jgi:O-antigen/teichoic acid export membrane protein